MEYLTIPRHEVAFTRLLGPERIKLLAEEGWKAAKAAGVSADILASLSNAEVAALHGYTDHSKPVGQNDYEILNKALRTGSDTEREALAPYVETIKAALAKLPNHAGAVSRITDLPDDVVKSLTPGGSYRDKGFMSTAIGMSGFKGKYVFFIKSRTGKHIESFSRYPRQQEVLYIPERKFQIISVNTRADGKVAVVLEEV
ncbi:MAG: ADP-ribosyltransferase domain-containing protein [Magnetococcus sp. DMHC-1]|nr:hypothetical protein [Magnetococcales bacterium]